MTEPLPVLDYAPQPAGSSLKKWFPLAFVIACAIFGAFFQALFQPRVYVASGILQLQTPLAAIANVDSQRSAHAAAIQSAAPSYIPALRAAGVNVAPARLNDQLEVKPIAQSTLIRVSFTSDSPREASAVVNTILTAYVATSPMLLIASPAVRPTAPLRNVFYPLAGAAAGALLALMLLALHKNRPLKHDHA